MKKHLIATLAFAALVSAGTAFADHRPRNVVVMGGTMSLAGRLAVPGRSMHGGQKLYVDKLNARGGQRHAFVKFDLSVVSADPAYAKGSPGFLVSDVRNAGSWDVVVLGRIDACWVCQFGPSPHVSYKRVLAGTVPSGRTAGRLPLVAVAERLLPKQGIPIYKSQQEEICLLKRVVVAGYEDRDVYRVVAVMEATPENLAAFLDH